MDVTQGLGIDGLVSQGLGAFNFNGVIVMPASRIGLLTRTVEISRFGGGFWKDGKFSRGRRTIYRISASVQPLKPNELLILPEGERNQEWVAIYTDFEIHTVNQKTHEAPDEVDIDGIFFQVHSAARWKFPGSPQDHWRVVAFKKADEGNTPE